jgi:hypothetical protein
MNRFLAIAVIPATLAVLSSPALAKFPDPSFSQVDPVVVGDAAGSSAFRVVFRDVTNAPLYSELATIDFSQSSVRLYAVQEPGVVVDCAARTLSRVTDHDGVAVFHPRFGGSCSSSSVQILGRGVMVVAMVPARSTDMDGLDGCTGLGDFGMFAERFLSSSPNPEADFDNSGGPLGLGDFSIFSRNLLNGVKGTYCP